MRTHLTESLRVEPHIAELCLGHSLGKIFKTYDQGTYIKERRDALERWDAWVKRLVTGEGAAVVGWRRLRSETMLAVSRATGQANAPRKAITDDRG